MGTSLPMGSSAGASHGLNEPKLHSRGAQEVVAIFHLLSVESGCEGHGDGIGAET